MSGKCSYPILAAALVAISLSVVAQPARAQVACEDFARLSGAIFTTDQNGNPVNMNIYPSKSKVYLDGGPSMTAPIGAAALPEGEYYFQVTDPSGKELLSSDGIESRWFRVSADGVIVEAVHPTRDDADYGGDPYFAKVVKLMPFDDTPNPGGVYKVWVTPVGCYSEGEGRNGFIPRYSKTDNFKVKGIDQTLCVKKFKDCDGDGAWDDTEPELVWLVDILEPVVETPEGPQRAVQEGVTVPKCVLAWDGCWTVVESLPFDGCKGWEVTALIIDGDPYAPSITAEVCFDSSLLAKNEKSETHTVIFGNRPLSSIKVCKWADCDGDGVGDSPASGITFTLTDEDGNVTTQVTGEDGCAVFCALPPGTYWVDEVLTADWLPVTDSPQRVDILCDDPPSEIALDFVNIPVGCIVACKFYDRDGDGNWDRAGDADGDGDNADEEPGIEGFKMVLSRNGVEVGTAYTGPDGCASFCGLLPGTYTVTEIIPTNCPWVATTSKSITVTLPCEPGGLKKAEFGNIIKGFADFDTKGYWHNKNGLDELTSGDQGYVNGLDPYDSPTDYFGAGDEPFDGWFEADPDKPVAAAYNNDGTATPYGEGEWQSEVSHFLTDNNGNASLNDHKEQLAQQLLAFIFNVRHRLDGDGAIYVPGEGWESTGDIIHDAILAWQGSNDAAIVAIKTKLDNLNKNNAVEYVLHSPGTCAPVPAY